MQDKLFLFFLILFLSSCVSRESKGLAPIDQWVAPDYTKVQNEWLLDYSFFNFYANSYTESCLLDAFETQESFNLKCNISKESIKNGTIGTLTWVHTDPCWHVLFHGGLVGFDGETAIICPLESLLDQENVYY